MKKIIVMTCLAFVSAFSAIAQGNKETATERATRLSDRMIQELRLNNFQANRLRAINQEKVNRMMEIEKKYAGNPALVDKNCRGVCKERDQELESFLSTDQYSMYYGARNKYYKYDKDFAEQIGATPTIAGKPDKTVLPIGSPVVPDKKSTTVLKADDSK